MWPDDCARRLLTSPPTQTAPTRCSSNRRICDVRSLTDKTCRVCSVGNNSPKSHCDLDCLLIKISIQLSHELNTDEIRKLNMNGSWNEKWIEIKPLSGGGQ